MSDKRKFDYVVKTNPSGISIKVDAPGRTVCGMFNAYNVLDSDGDILMPGCAKRSIKDRGPESNATAKIKHCLNHNLTQLPGKIKVLKETTVDGIDGLYFESEMADTTLGNDTLKNYLAGIYDNHSIGFRYMQLEMVEKTSRDRWKEIKNSIKNPKDMDMRDRVWLVKEIDLFEGSTVAFGANSLTPYFGTKSFNPEVLKLDIDNQISTIEKLAKGGDKSEDILEAIELHSRQLKQMVSEIVGKIDFKKEAETTTVANKINLSTLAAHL